VVRLVNACAAMVETRSAKLERTVVEQGARILRMPNLIERVLCEVRMEVGNLSVTYEVSAMLELVPDNT
jgi:hypothetical protein